MKTNLKSNSAKLSSSNIQNEIDAIFHLVKSTLPEGVTIRKERPANGVSCKGYICIYRKDQLLDDDLDTEVSANRQAKPTPAIRLAFYAGDVNPRTIGSIAIYGEKASAQYLALKTRRVLFGRRILSLSLEYGRRPFVDVKLGI